MRVRGVNWMQTVGEAMFAAINSPLHPLRKPARQDTIRREERLAALRQKGERIWTAL